MNSILWFTHTTVCTDAGICSESCDVCHDTELMQVTASSSTPLDLTSALHFSKSAHAILELQGAKLSISYTEQMGFAKHVDIIAICWYMLDLSAHVQFEPTLAKHLSACTLMAMWGALNQYSPSNIANHTYQWRVLAEQLPKTSGRKLPQKLSRYSQW